MAQARLATRTSDGGSRRPRDTGKGDCWAEWRALGFQLRAEAALENLTQEVTKSSEIEGEVLDWDQVRSSIARRLGMDVGAVARADQNVEGVVEMMLDATQKFAEPLTADRLFGWHAALISNRSQWNAKDHCGCLAR